MNSEERKVAAQILRDAKDLMQRKEFDYVCNAVECAACDIGHIDIGRTLRLWILRLLGARESLNTWLHFERNVPLHETTRQRGRMRATRLAWIDWMIAEMERP